MINEPAMTQIQEDILPNSVIVDGHPASTRVSTRDGRYLFHPVIDFLCLGGGSLIVLFLMVLLLPSAEAKPQVGAICFALAMVINYPHFAHSYQIFYRNFRHKGFGGTYNPVLRARYIFAGVVIPMALLSFFAIGLISGGGRYLGYGANAMLFLVGWHYVKQGYGMLIVDSVFKRKFFTDREKSLLVFNAYACWAYAWVYANHALNERDYLGLKYYTFDLPIVLLYAALGGVAITTALVLIVCARRLTRDGPGLPFNGTMAYVATLYFWIAFSYAWSLDASVQINPAFILTIPVFHSLQYLVVVWRYQLNLEKDRQDGDWQPKADSIGRFIPSVAIVRFAIFIVVGTVLGFVGFLGAPVTLQNLIPYDMAIFGETLFLFLFWIFINVHHYFIDNVIWRRENPDVGKYLFAQQ